MNIVFQILLVPVVSVLISNVRCDHRNSEMPIAAIDELEPQLRDSLLSTLLPPSQEAGTTPLVLGNRRMQFGKDASDRAVAQWRELLPARCEWLRAQSQAVNVLSYGAQLPHCWGIESASVIAMSKLDPGTAYRHAIDVSIREVHEDSAVITVLREWALTHATREQLSKAVCHSIATREVPWESWRVFCTWMTPDQARALSEDLLIYLRSESNLLTRTLVVDLISANSTVLKTPLPDGVEAISRSLAVLPGMPQLVAAANVKSDWKQFPDLMRAAVRVQPACDAQALWVETLREEIGLRHRDWMLSHKESWQAGLTDDLRRAWEICLGQH